MSKRPVAPHPVWQDLGVAGIPATRLRFVSDGSGGFVLASSSTMDAALVSDGAGGYVLTPGATTSDAMIAQVGSSILIR